MAIQRVVSTSIWTDDWFLEECTQLQQRAFFYLLTNPSTNIAGIYQLNMRHLPADLTTRDNKVSPKDVDSVFEFFEAEKKAYRREGWVIVPAWPRHQRIGERGKVYNGLVAILDSLPPWLKVLLMRHEIPYEFDIDRLSVEHQWTTDRPGHNSDSDSDSESDSDSDSDVDSDGVKHLADWRESYGTTRRRAGAS